MKKAIFLVEDIINNQPVTLYEKISWNLTNELEHCGRPLMWLRENPRLLGSYESEYIKFVKVADFIKEVETSGMPADLNVYYYISCRYSLDLTNPQDFLLIDYPVIKFLSRQNIPIILDSSYEQVHHYNSAFELFSSGRTAWLYDRVELEILKTIQFIVLGSTIIPSAKNNVHNLNVRYGTFPAGFFFYNYKHGPYYNSLRENESSIIERIKSKQITEETFVWEAWQHEPRWFRTLFQLKAESKNLTGKIGRYSRLNKGRQRLLNFIHDKNHPHGRCPEIVGHPYFNFLTDELLNMADEIRLLDGAVKWPGDKCSLVLPETDSMFIVAMETCEPRTIADVINSTSNLTEKSTLRITSGQAFIPLGGQHLGSILKDLGFKDFKKLEWPCLPHIFDELDYVIDRIEDIASLSLEQRRVLYADWQENLLHNFHLYMNIDIPKEYLRSVYRATE